MADIPDSVRRFIRKAIHSVGELEILLLLRENARTEWDVAGVTKTLRMEFTAVEVRLERLAAGGLLETLQRGSEKKFRFAPAAAELATAVEELVRWYGTHHVAIITLIYSNPSDSIRTFSDAFRIRRDEDK